MKKQKSLFIKVLPALLVIVGLLMGFYYYIGLNEERVHNEVKKYVEEVSNASMVSISQLLTSDYKSIQSTSYLYGTSLSSAEVNLDLLKDLEKNTNFDYIRFIDLQGNDFTSDGSITNIADRDYFQKGISGETGITVVASSRINGEKLLGFYSPVYYQNEIVGMMLGFVKSETIANVLEIETYGYHCIEALIDLNQVILSSNKSVGNSSVEQLVDSYLDGKSKEEFISALTQRETYEFDCHVSNNTTTFGILLPVKGYDLVLCFIYPPQALNASLASIRSIGLTVMDISVIIFAIYSLFLGYLWLKTKKENERMSTLYQDIITSLSVDYDSIYYVDLLENKFKVYRISDDVKDLINRLIRDNYTYDQMIDFMVKYTVCEEDKEKLRSFCSIENLQANINKNQLSLMQEFRNDIGGKQQYIRIKFVKVGSREETTELVMAFADVDSQKQQELERQRLLSDAYQSANQANEAKTLFLSSMSHEMRTPLNGIIGMTEIAQNHMDDMDKVQDCLGKINKAGDQLLGVINSILDLSKIESGKSSLEMEIFDLQDGLNDIVDSMESQIIAHNHTLITDFADIVDHYVLADKIKIQKILINLLSNAIKYTNDGGLIQFSVKESQPNYYDFSIRDNGIGMSEETVEALFKPFVRGEDTRINKIQGTGLGMAISKSLANMMGGDIYVESQLGVGSCFTVSLYLQPAQKEELSVIDDSVDINNLHLNDKRILIVEDNSLNIEVACELIGLCGAEIDTAENGKIAVEKVLENGEGYYDLIFMDIQMPIMNGHEASREIRALELFYTKSLPIIAMTANAFTDDIVASKAAGMDEHLSKPLDVNMIAKVLKKYLD